METAFAQAPGARITLRQVLNFDAATCIAFGLLLVIGTAPLSGLLGLPQALLFYSGLVLFPSAALMLIAARKLSAPLVGVVIAGNAAWVVASVIVAFALEPTGLGVAFVLAQAAAVLVLLVLEWKAR
jgi:hypothetical protein